MADNEQLKKKVDEYYGDMKYKEIADCLATHKNSDDVGLLWRLARAEYELQKSLTSEDARLEALQATFSVVERALTIDQEDANAHKWMAIYLNAITKIQGSKAQIEKGQAIKDHMVKACELGSEDPTNWHLIGMWEYTVADISWVMRKLATVVYGEPPKATFEEALEHFTKAEEHAAGFSTTSAGQGLEWPIRSRNLLMIAKCHQKLKDNDNAAKYLQMVVDRDAKHSEDQEAKEEATDLLKRLSS